MSFQGSPPPSTASSYLKDGVLTSHVVEITDSATQSRSAYERRLLLKLDFRIIPILYCLLVIMLIDRANIGNVRIEGILEDLKMKGNDYNVAILVYTVPFMLFELPSSLALRSFRPAVWISLIMFGWGE
jgi:predicted permease